jgi:hypothetical protein
LFQSYAGSGNSVVDGLSLSSTGDFSAVMFFFLCCLLWFPPRTSRQNCLLLANVKEHAPLSARAGVDRADGVVTTDKHVNKAADRGCCVSSCCASCFTLDVSLFDRLLEILVTATERRS